MRLLVRLATKILIFLLTFLLTISFVSIFEKFAVPLDEDLGIETPEPDDRADALLPKTTTFADFPFVPAVSFEQPVADSTENISEFEPSLEELLSLMGASDLNVKWMGDRISAHWTHWLLAYRSFKASTNFTDISLRRNISSSGYHVWFNLGILQLKDWGKLALKGERPVGELVQWADAIAALYFATEGNISFTYQKPKTIERFKELFGEADENSNITDSITFFTDILGWRRVKSLLQGRVMRVLKCRAWFLDSFGTEHKFNCPRCRRKVEHGGLEMNLRQFFTYFPHTPNNTFAGFAFYPPDYTNCTRAKSKEPTALVYAKDKYLGHAPGGIEFVAKLAESGVPVHTTLKEEDLPLEWEGLVINHSVLPAGSFSELLCSTFVYIGFGFPVEGPGAVEALAHGNIFLASKVDEENFFSTKPTSRRPKYQHDFLVEKPELRTHVIPIDYRNESQVNSTIQFIKDLTAVEPLYVEEFLPVNHLRRLAHHLVSVRLCSDYKTSCEMFQECEL